jgi:hypothetical protein
LEDFYSTKEMNAWNEHWFGFWKEFGRGYDKCPSWETFVLAGQPSDVVGNELDYLRAGTRLCVTGILFNVEKRQVSLVSRSMEVLTDGSWVWPRNLVQFVVHYGVRLPSEFRKHMASHRYQCPPVERVDRNALPWPE